MFNKVLVTVGKIIYKKPTVHTKSPKMIVSHFANSINPEPVIVNLENVNTVKLTTVLEKKDGVADLYKLNLTFKVTGQDSEEICLAKFETKKEADEALYLLTYKLYSPFKGFFKTVATIIALFFLYVFIDIVSFSNFSSGQLNMKEQAKVFQSMPIEMQKRMLELEGMSMPKPTVQEMEQIPNNNQNSPVQAIPAAPVLSEDELKSLFEEATRLTREANESNQNLSVDVPNLGEQPEVNRSQGSYLTPGDAFLNKL